MWLSAFVVAGRWCLRPGGQVRCGAGSGQVRWDAGQALRADFRQAGDGAASAVEDWRCRTWRVNEGQTASGVPWPWHASVGGYAHVEPPANALRGGGSLGLAGMHLHPCRYRLSFRYATIGLLIVSTKGPLHSTTSSKATQHHQTFLCFAPWNHHSSPHHPHQSHPTPVRPLQYWEITALTERVTGPYEIDHTHKRLHGPRIFDDLRYPKFCSLATSGLEPLFGPSSSHCSVCPTRPSTR